MNIYIYELKSHYKGLIGWSVGMLFLLFAGMNKYAAYKTTGTSITDLVEQFPHSVQVIFGFNGLDIATPVGYFGTLYLYIILTAGVYAAIRGADIIAKEERDQTAEFLIPKPVSRDKIVSAKLFAALTLVFILWLVTVVSSFAVMAIYAKGADVAQTIWLMMLADILLMMVFMRIGSAIGAYWSRPKLAVTVASMVVLGTYLLSVIINIEQRLNWLSILTPFTYFSAVSIIGNHTLSTPYVMFSIFIVAVTTLLTYTGFRKRDL